MTKIKCYILSILALLCFANTLLASTQLNTLNVSSKGEDAIVTLTFSKALNKMPLHFSMQQPHRVVIDLPNTFSKLPLHQAFPKSTLIKNIQTIEANNKTRMIINLRKITNYTVKHVGNKVTVELSPNEKSKVKLKRITQIHVENMEFTVGDVMNSGKIHLKLSDDAGQPNIKKNKDQVIITFDHMSVPEKLAHKYDVKEYNTVVNNISLFRKGHQARLIINNKKNATVATYEVDNDFVIEVSPVKTKTSVVKAAYHGKRISLNFQKIPVRSVLQIISEFMNSNVIISDKITGTISLRLNNIPWDQALSIILQTQGLVKKTYKNVIMIAPAGEIAAQEKRLLDANENMKALGQLSDETFHIKYGKANIYAETLKNPSNKFLSSRGKVVLNERTNKLFITDTKERLDNIKSYIAKTDMAVKQVEIEARIVKVSDSFSRELGIKWNGLSPKSGAENSSGSQLALSTIASNPNINLELAALEASGDADILSSPRLLTADRQEALIEQGTEIPYQQSTSSGAAAVTFIKAVLSLKVTPQVTPDNKVLLKLQVKQDAIGEIRGDLPPAIDTRNITTNVLIKNGDTVVLGGIYESSKHDAITRVPFLSSIPLLGGLFRYSSTETKRTELLIFITPRVVPQDLD